jgi:SAM-dependent methyltransferase
MDKSHLEANRANWEQRVPVHVASKFYNVPSFLRGETQLRDFELQELGDVKDKTLLHLQCHFGLDTLSWAREGARVVGLDFSSEAVRAAQKLCQEANLATAEFVLSDVYDAEAALDHRQFDIVYTGLGAVVWLSDIVKWAKVVAALVKPGGTFYMSEFHPIADVFADESLQVVNHYFDHGKPFVGECGGTYTDGDTSAFEHNVEYNWTHTVSSVISALTGAGLRLELFNEHDFTLYQRFPALELQPDRKTYRFPEGHPRLPLMYSVRFTKPV